MSPPMPPERYRLICAVTLGDPIRGEYRYTAESHAGLATLLPALATHRGQEWDTITIGPPVAAPDAPQHPLWKE